MSARIAKMEFVKLLIMENLPVDGRYLDITDLENSVNSDLFSVKKHNDPVIFQSALEYLNDKQYVFINKGKRKVAATQYGINRFN